MLVKSIQKKLLSGSGLLLTGLTLFSSARVATAAPLASVPENKQTDRFTLTSNVNVQYETYQNELFGFVVNYPNQLLFPLSPLNNIEGREFVSTTRDIRMVVYGRPQVDQSLEAYYQSHLQSYDLRGAEVNYAYLGDNEFVISGYEPSGEAFYRKTLLNQEDFLVLGVNYDRALQPELDEIVGAIATSFQPLSNQATKQITPDESTYEVPSAYLPIQIYFPEADTEIFTEVAPVVRVTDRADLVDYAVEQLLVGPTQEERAQVQELAIQPVGESTCGDDTFIAEIIGGTAVVQFCRDVIVGGIGDGASAERAFLSTLNQFATVTQIVLLNNEGECLFDATGNDDCLAFLPDSFTSGI